MLLSNSCFYWLEINFSKNHSMIMLEIAICSQIGTISFMDTLVVKLSVNVRFGENYKRTEL